MRTALLDAEGFVRQVLVRDIEQIAASPGLQKRSVDKTVGVGDRWDGANWIPAPTEQQQAPPTETGLTPMQIAVLYGRANFQMSISAAQSGDLYWHRDGATTPFEIDGVQMDAETFVKWADALI